MTREEEEEDGEGTTRGVEGGIVGTPEGVLELLSELTKRVQGIRRIRSTGREIHMVNEEW